MSLTCFAVCVGLLEFLHAQKKNRHPYLNQDNTIASILKVIILIGMEDNAISCCLFCGQLCKDGKGAKQCASCKSLCHAGCGGVADLRGFHMKRPYWKCHKCE